jgi:uncharacterized glyoxalase superfamily protein PhnB
MKPTPPGWPRISSAVFYEDPARAIDWLCDAFGFEVQMKVVGDGGRIEHSELVYGGGLVMVGGVGDAKPHYLHRRAPSQLGGMNTQSMMVYVDDVEAHCTRARKAGAKIVSEPETTDYGEEYWTDRGYECEDLGGHHWWFIQRLRNTQPKS